MKLYRIRRIQTLPLSLDEAWNFFSSPSNLPEITPPWLHLRVVGEIADRMFPGMVIEYRVAPFLGIPFHWITEITHVDPPHYFVDEQRLGPYRFWLHQHHFKSVETGVEVIDAVHYGLRLGPFGRLIHALIIGKQLREIFDFRRRKLEQVFGNAQG
jgi:ligand-binding SRPBCC domain-containing protein